MSDNDIKTDVNPSISMTKATMGIDPRNNDQIAHMLALATMAGGSEKIDPTSLVSGKTPKLLPCAKVDLSL